MEAKEFQEVNVRIAENQPEYETLPAHFNKQEGSLTYCFELSEHEKEVLAKTGKFWLKQYTGGNPMQPIFPTVNKDMVL